MLAKGQTHPVMLDAAAEMERFIETYLPRSAEQTLKCLGRRHNLLRRLRWCPLVCPTV